MNTNEREEHIATLEGMRDGWPNGCASGGMQKSALDAAITALRASGEPVAWQYRITYRDGLSGDWETSE